MIKCTFDLEINNCPFYNKDNNRCVYEKKCSFQAEDKVIDRYVRKERWYEKYYKK